MPYKIPPFIRGLREEADREDRRLAAEAREHRRAMNRANADRKRIAAFQQALAKVRR